MIVIVSLAHLKHQVEEGKEGKEDHGAQDRFEPGSTVGMLLIVVGTVKWSQVQ